jgi:protein ImuB
MFAVLHIADFALHAVVRNEPGSSGQPAALFANTSKKSVVLATTPAARAAGVELGMTAPQAVARCPQLLIRAPHADAEAEARAALLAVGFTLSPAIEDTAPGVCTADLHGASSDKRIPACRHATTELAALGLPATAGLAATPLLALYAARSATSASSLGPSALVVPVTDATNFLAPLPLAAADPPPELAAILHSWGLRTLGQLTALPRDEIVRRFGTTGLDLWQRACGGSNRPLHPVTPPQTFSAAMELEDAVQTLEPLLFLLRRFLDRLTLELQASQHVAAEIHLTLRLEDETSYARSFRLPEPTADTEILFRTLHTHLETVQTASAIVALELRLTPARPLVRQQGLFETGLRDPHGFAETLARIGTPRLEDTHRPDAVKLIPPLPVVPPPAEPPLHPPLGVPLRRFRPPLPARVEFTAGRPTYLWTEHVRGEIVTQSPAYPSSGNWWQPDRAWARTEHDVALADGGLYRLLRIENTWFIEGEYD